MAKWSFLTNHSRALVCIAQDPGVRLRDIAAALGITERSAFDIVADLTTSGYVVKDKEGRRNRYHIQTHIPLHNRSVANRPSASCWRSWSTPESAGGPGRGSRRGGALARPDGRRGWAGKRPGP